MIRQLVYSLFLTLVWCLFTESFSRNTIIAGFIISAGIVYFLRRTHIEQHFMHRLVQIIQFILIFLREVIKANLAVLRIVYRRNLKETLKPGILEYPIEVATDFSITLLANAITLTPGTLTIEVSPDRKYLYVHFLHIDDPEAAKKEIKQILEKPILKIWGKKENNQ